MGEPLRDRKRIVSKRKTNEKRTRPMQQLNGTSKDILAENIEKLKELFPEVFSEGKIDFKKFEEELGNFTCNEPERYNFTWAGKSEAKKIAQTPSTGTLRPCKEESKKWDTTQNLYIEGDNLEVLKLLQKSYYKQVKMIYIDPPYNTGKDFVYKDNFHDNIKNYLEITGQVDSDGNKLSTNSDTNGHYHSDWLSMMYPRLQLARNLLKDDGVIFISIGEQEVHNLRKLCDEIFGENNFIGEAGRISKKANNQGDYWAPNFDYVLTYAKNLEFCESFFGGINYEAYKEVETDGERKGEKYQLIRLYMTSLDPMRGCKNQRYYIECPDGTFVIPPGINFPEIVSDGSCVEPKNEQDKVWRWAYASYLEKKDQLCIKRVKSSNLVDEHGNPAQWNVFTKTFLNDVINNSTASPNNFIEDHINQMASHELKKLDIPFDFAKPSSLIKFFANTCRARSDAVILDFFSGSATTAHAVMQLNAEDEGNRKFILVQLPETTDNKKYPTICEIGKERIRRAGEKIIADNSDKDLSNLDIGFKVLKLDSSNIKAWDSNFENVEGSLLDAVENIKEDRSSEDLLYEILLKYGLDLTLPIEEKVIDGKKVFVIGYGALVACLDDDITIPTVEAIAKLKEHYQSEIMRVVFKDASFKDAVVKTNAYQILKQFGIDEVVSV